MLERYLWLLENYRPHDRIILFRFSRRAFTVRAFVLIVPICGGVLKLRPNDPARTTTLLEIRSH